VKGFTLIEVMITVVIVAILAAIAYPSYRQYIIRSDRAAAQSVMMDIANREQQFLMANRAYADKATVTASGFSLDSDLANKYDWDITVGTGTVPAFTITFTPKGSQASDVTLTLNHQGVKTPADKW
jgi:type IV pilus assembly protein PilE